jgi:predicted transcriptional regulator
MSKRAYTIKLPATLGKRVERTARKQRRKPSELAVEALKRYFSSREISTENPTPAELRAILRGEAAIQRGDYITLDELRREGKVAGRPRRPRAKSA